MSPNTGDPSKGDENLVGILKNGTSNPTLANGVEKPVDGEPNGSRDGTPNGIIRRNSSTPSLRQFVNSASPLIEEEPDDEEKEEEESSNEENEEEGFSENPVSARILMGNFWSHADRKKRKRVVGASFWDGAGTLSWNEDLF